MNFTVSAPLTIQSVACYFSGTVGTAFVLNIRDAGTLASTRSQFDDFAQFDARMIRVTHSNHALSPALYAEVREKFEAHLTPQGVTFINPQRVDLLQKPA